MAYCYILIGDYMKGLDLHIHTIIRKDKDLVDIMKVATELHGLVSIT